MEGEIEISVTVKLEERSKDHTREYPYFRNSHNRSHHKNLARLGRKS